MDIKYELIRANRKTVGITVTGDRRVIVRAPYCADDGEIEEIVKKHSLWIEKKLSEKSGRKEEELSENEKARLVRICEGMLFERVKYYADLTGLKPQRVRISLAEKRFGSCSTRGAIAFSAYLMLYPEEAWDLVIVHELCHLRHMNHSKDFYSLLSSFLPDHKERKKLLKPENRLTMSEILEKYGSFSGK